MYTKITISSINFETILARVRLNKSKQIIKSGGKRPLFETLTLRNPKHALALLKIPC